MLFLAERHYSVQAAKPSYPAFRSLAQWPIFEWEARILQLPLVLYKTHVSLHSSPVMDSWISYAQELVRDLRGRVKIALLLPLTIVLLFAIINLSVRSKTPLEASYG